MAEPGWYPDPSNAPQQRWWDGRAWGNETRPSGDAGVGTLPAPAYAAPAYAPPAPFPSAATPPAPSTGSGASARRGFTLGLTAAGLAAAVFLITFFGAAVPALNWTLFLAILLVLAATVVGVIGVIFSGLGLAGRPDPRLRQRAGVGLGTSIVGVLSFLALLLGGLLAAAVTAI